MNLQKIILLILLTIIITAMNRAHSQSGKVIRLPQPALDSDFSIEKAMQERRSVRSYSGDALTIEQLSQLLWACQGVSASVSYERDGIKTDYHFRTAPSAGALYPLEVYAVVKDVEGLEPGVYHYLPRTGGEDHAIERVIEGDRTVELANAALNQDCIKDAAVNIVITTFIERTAVKYGERAEQYVMIETGHAGQNICLQAQSLGLGVVTVGAFFEEKIKMVIGTDAKPVYIICVGRK